MPRRTTPPAARGFTLMELLVALVVVGVLASLALPTFTDSIRKSRRAEAFAALAVIQQAQERWRSNRASFAASVGNPPDHATTPGLGLPGTTAGGYYALEITAGSASATGYEAVASAVADTSQADDAQCRRIGVRVAGATVTYAGCGGSATCELTYAATNSCWAR